MADELTVREKLLLAADTIDQGDGFHIESLTIEAWSKWPQSFGMRTRPDLPDHNRAVAKLSGADGLCGLGWLKHRTANHYQVTAAGRKRASSLRSWAATATPKPAALKVQHGPRKAPQRSNHTDTPTRTATRPKPPAERQETPSCTPPLSAWEIEQVNALAKTPIVSQFSRGLGRRLAWNDAVAFWQAADHVLPTDITTLLTRASEAARTGCQGLPSFGVIANMTALQQLLCNTFGPKP